VIVRWIIDERFKQYFTIRKKKDKKILPHQQWNLLIHFQGEVNVKEHQKLG
jgi:hypothetical protein